MIQHDVAQYKKDYEAKTNLLLLSLLYFNRLFYFLYST